MIESLAGDPRFQRFVRESNRIEGIHEVRRADVPATIGLIGVSPLTVGEIEDYVRAVAGERLRDRPGMNVRVGTHVPEPGGAGVRVGLETLVDCWNKMPLRPFEMHAFYERLHPFMDGNGRSGRALWLRQMIREEAGERALDLGFLHCWYYQSLSG